MSGALIDEPFVAVTPTLIRTFGANLAIVIQFVHFACRESYVGGPRGECTLFHQEISDGTGLSIDVIRRTTLRGVELGVLNAERRKERGRVSQSVQRVTYSINYDHIPEPGAPPMRNRRGDSGPSPMRNRRGTDANSQGTHAKSQGWTTPDVGKRTTEEVEEVEEEPSSSSGATQEGCPQAVDSATAPEFFADLIRHGATVVDDDGSEATAPEQIAIEVARALGRRDTTPRVQELKSIKRAATKKGWPAAEIIARAHRAALADQDPEGYWKTTLTELANTRPPTDLAERRPKATTGAASGPRRPPSDRGMSPPSAPQLRADEGWDRPDVVAAGIANARRAMIRRPSPPEPPPDIESKEAVL